MIEKFKICDDAWKWMMSPLEWLRYRLHGVVWRIPIWLIVLLITAVIVINVFILVLQPWPHPIMTANIEYDIRFNETEVQWFVYVSGTIANIGTANATCSIEISVHDKRGYDYSETIDLGLIVQGHDVPLPSKKYFIPTVIENQPFNVGNIEVRYRLFY